MKPFFIYLLLATSMISALDGDGHGAGSPAQAAMRRHRGPQSQSCPGRPSPSALELAAEAGVLTLGGDGLGEPEDPKDYERRTGHAERLYGSRYTTQEAIRGLAQPFAGESPGCPSSAPQAIGGLAQTNPGDLITQSGYSPPDREEELGGDSTIQDTIRGYTSSSREELAARLTSPMGPDGLAGLLDVVDLAEAGGEEEEMQD